MINYADGFFGIHTLFRIRGSAAYRAFLSSTFSSGWFLLLYYYGGYIEDTGVFGIKQYNLLDHPYPITAFITVFTIVLSTKVTFSYNRFWEACTALHNMHAKFLDCGSTLAAFHMQSKHYDPVSPPSFGDHQHLENMDHGLVIRRHGTHESETDETDYEYSNNVPGGLKGGKEKDTFETEEDGESNTSGTRRFHFASFLKRRKSRRREGVSKAQDGTTEMVTISSESFPRKLPFPSYHNSPQVGLPPHHERRGRTDRVSLSVCENKNSVVPSLFLQEAAHLVSLLSAVGLSTLRCESDDAKATFTEFVPNDRWPNYNSDNDPDLKKYGYRKGGFVKTLQYIFDVSKTEKERRQYDAARPFPVIGGVSDREALMLESTRGGLAKTALVFMWLNEFIIREQMHGSLGGVAPPIVSRLQQYASDGHFWYNAARKMSYIPFPFPHTQMAALFEIVAMFLLPVLILSKAEVWFGFTLNFFTVLLLTGLNELSKEYEHPFRGMPNDLPLNLFHAQFNEGIVTMFAGFHPDAWWEMKDEADYHDDDDCYHEDP